MGIDPFPEQRHGGKLLRGQGTMAGMVEGEPVEVSERGGGEGRSKIGITKSECRFNDETEMPNDVESPLAFLPSFGTQILRPDQTGTQNDISRIFQPPTM